MFLSSSPPAHVAVLLAVPLALAALHPAAARSQEMERASPSLAFTPVTVIDVREGLARPDRTVVIEGDRIVATGPADSVEIPAGARVVDGTGKYLIPGLWDMHVHLFNQISGRPPNEWYFPLLVANGVTGVREMWTKAGDVGTLTEWRQRTATGELLAPRIAAAGALVDGPGSWWPSADSVATPGEAREFVRSASADGLDFIKVYSSLSREAYFAVLEEAKHLGIPVAGHVPLVVRAGDAAAAGQRSNEHLHQIREGCSTSEERIISERRKLYPGPFTAAQDDSLWERHERMRTNGYDPERCATLAKQLAAAGMWQVPTLVNERSYFLGPEEGAERDPRLAYLPPDERRFWREGLGNYTDIETNSHGGLDERLRRWEITKDVVSVLARGSVPFLAGTDLGTPGLYPGFSLHDELELLVEARLTPAEALRAATLEPARYLEATDSLGTVEAGKLADLVLLDANPLEDITNTQRIRAVVVDGRYLDRAALDELLATRDSVSSEDRSPAEEGQEAEVPRTRTFPGLEEAPYPYVEPEEVGLSAERLEELGDRVAGWVQDSSIVGAEILVVKDRKIVLHEAIGWSDRKAGEPMRRNTIYRLRSMTKPFTGTAALMLVEEGKLALDAPVARWLPSWDNERSGEITVRQLLTHTAGWVQGGLPDPLRSYSNLRAAVDAAGEAGPQHPPGEAFRYSDVHSYTLGALVAEVSGMPVERFIEERILGPLGLANTHTRFAPDTAWADRMNPTYRWKDSVWFQYWHPDSAQVHPFFRASGGLYSTVFDYARWMDAWMQWAGLVKPPTGEAAAPRLLSEAMSREALAPSELGAYGFHWDIESLDPLVFEHGGSDGTLATAIPSRNTMVLYFTQSRGNETRGEWYDAAFEAVAPGIEFPRPTPSLPAAEADLEPVEVPVTELERYAGAYVFLGDTLTFAMEGGRVRVREFLGPRVTLDGRSVPHFTLVPIGDRTFAFGRYEAGELVEVYLPTQRLRFEVEQGQIVGFRPTRGEREGPFAPKIR